MYLLRLALEPGKYELRAVSGEARAFPVIGQFYLRLQMDMDVAPNSVTYLGRVTATMRPRIGEEFRAGFVVPLIDQAAAHLSTSTYDVTVTDAAREDIAAFKSSFPALAATDIRTQLLPPFDRAKIQVWWDGAGDKDGGAAGAKQADAKPADAKPAEVKQAEVKQADAKQAAK